MSLVHRILAYLWSVITVALGWHLYSRSSHLCQTYHEFAQRIFRRPDIIASIYRKHFQNRQGQSCNGWALWRVCRHEHGWDHARPNDEWQHISYWWRQEQAGKRSQENELTRIPLVARSQRISSRMPCIHVSLLQDHWNEHMLTR
eukprot:COSAG05_NODE_11479_length_511_cov_1.177184_1_plen_145_part_10